jgi:hypothetical protein
MRVEILKGSAAALLPCLPHAGVFILIMDIVSIEKVGKGQKKNGKAQKKPQAFFVP